MSAVDVLAVMDAAALSLANAGDARSAIKANKARAAVAELIEAASNPALGFFGVSAKTGRAKEAALDRLHAALARCKGEQA